MISYYYQRDNVLLREQGDIANSIPAGVLWIDLLQPSQEEESFVERALGVNIPTREEMAEIEESSRFYQSGDTLYLTPTVISGIADHAPVSEEIFFVVGADCLVTVRYAEMTAVRAFEGRSLYRTETQYSKDLIFALLVDACIDRIADTLEVLQARISGLLRRVFNGQSGDSSAKAAREKADLQQVIQDLGRFNGLLSMLSESLLTFGRLITYARLEGRTWLGAPARELLKAVERDANSLSQYQARMSEEIAFLLDATLGLINIEQNNIIKVFSIAAVLFLPPTLVGTVYGMNFDGMPELHWQLGYPSALGLMVLSAIGSYALFKFKHWL